MYYYELLHKIPAGKYPSLMVNVEPGIYRSKLSPADLAPRIAFGAERVWHEYGNTVDYFKHRQQNLTVDMKEFMFIKLTAKELG